MTAIPYRVAACDLDSTILSGSCISPENRAAVQFLKERNVTVVLTTGRNFHHAVPYYRKLGLSGPMITSDGCLVSIPGAAGGILSEHSMPAEVATAIFKEAATRQLTCLNFFRHGIYVTSRFDWHEGMERHRDMGRHFRDTSVDAMSRRAVYKSLLFSLQPEKLDEIVAVILAKFGADVDAIRNNPHTVEFISKGISKVTGLVAVAKHLGIESAQVVAFGDGVNDVGMFGWAGLSVCMNHGHQDAKDSATIVAPFTAPESNFAAAVAAAFGSTA